MLIHNLLWLWLCGIALSSETTVMKANTSYGNSNNVLLKTLHFLKFKNDLEFSSMSIVLDEQNCKAGMFCEGIMRGLFSKENYIPFNIIPTYYGTKHLNITNSLKTSVRGTQPSLIIFDNIFETKVLRDMFSLIGEALIKNNYWLFLTAAITQMIPPQRL